MKQFLKNFTTFKTKKRKQIWTRWLWPIIGLTLVFELTGIFKVDTPDPSYYVFNNAIGSIKKMVALDIFLLLQSLILSIILVSIFRLCVYSKVIRYGLIVMLCYFFGEGYIRIHTKYCDPIPFQRMFSKLGYHACEEVMDVDFIVKANNDETGKEEINSIKLKVPRWYLPKGITQAERYFTFYLAYPTFEPYYKARKDHYKEIDKQPIRVELEEFFSVYRPKHEPAPYATYIEDVYNLKGYVLESDKTKITAKSLKYMSFDYYPKEDNNLDYIGCGYSHYLPGAGNCRMHIYLSDRIKGEVFFDSKLLKDWEKIDEAVRKVFVSFIVDSDADMGKIYSNLSEME